MKQLFLSHTKLPIRQHLDLTGSKSESNRALILNALFPRSLELKNISNAQDTVILKEVLTSDKEVLDIHHAGTAMRFLTAYKALTTDKEVTLTGSSRMRERPIRILVTALRELGAKITYLENEGFPPIKINKSKLTATKIALPANVSSQYISALMLIAPKLKSGLTIQLTRKITSLPYLQMTAAIMQKVGLTVDFKDNTFFIPNHNTLPTSVFAIESDWSSASYHFAIAAIASNAEIQLKTLKKDSLQGDAAIADIFTNYFGVNVKWQNESVLLTSNSGKQENHLELDLNKTPDIAQTIAVVCFAKGMSCKLTGLETLKIKETDRLLALQTELEKFGAVVHIGEDFLQLEAGKPSESKAPIATYNDHRMAMAFAPLALLFPIRIEDPQVVQKSYPNFWEDLHKMNFKTEYNVD